MTTFRLNICSLLISCPLMALLSVGAAAADTEPPIEVEIAALQPIPSTPELSQPQSSPDLSSEVLTGMAELTEHQAELSLSEALELALSNHPGLASLEKEYLALDSLAWQEGRKPNPSLELELGEFGGTGEAQGVRALATSLTYSQLLERGGKRTKREIAASLERELVGWDIAELEHQIQASVRQAYAAAQVAQYEVAQLAAYGNLLVRIHETVSINVEAGRSARLELERLEVELSRLELDQAIAERNLAQTLLALAATWGVTSVEFDSVELANDFPVNLPSLAAMAPLLVEHPALGRFSAEYEALCALVDLENANAVPDLEVFGGVTRLNEIEETVFNVGVAWDLQTHDRNEGNISAAAYRLAQMEDNRSAARQELETELAALCQAAGHAMLNYQAYGDSLLPAAAEILTLTEEGYRYGKFELLDVLDTQRTVLELESEQAAAQMELHLQLAEIEALLNINLTELAGAALVEAPSPNSDSQANEYLKNKEHDHA